MLENSNQDMCCFSSVSYTHLDVYKRQTLYIPADGRKHLQAEGSEQDLYTYQALSLIHI